MRLLEHILKAKQRQVAKLMREELPEPPELRPLPLRRAPGEPLRLIAEIKRRSPSAGQLSTRLSVRQRSAAYQRAGARMVSVLCDREFFDGDFSHLAEARRGCSLPLLCKDFIVHERQLDAARAWGADAALLIVRCLPPPRVAALVAEAQLRGLEPLVEITTEAEAQIALDADAELIGVNARDLDTLRMDSERAARVIAMLPERVTAVHLSGLKSAPDVLAVAQSKAHAALVGESLMRAHDPEALLGDLVAAAGG